MEKYEQGFTVMRVTAHLDWQGLSETPLRPLPLLTHLWYPIPKEEYSYFGIGLLPFFGWQKEVIYQYARLCLALSAGT